MAGKRRKFPRWWGSEEKPPRNPRIKLGDIMGGNFLIFGLCSFGSLLLLSSFNAVPFSLIRLILNKRAIEASVRERTVLYIRTGDVLEIKLEVPENRRRLSIYKGMVISTQNADVHTTIRIRRIIAGVGVEIVFPVCRHCQS